MARRAKHSASTFLLAQALADAYDMKLTNPAQGGYQLRHIKMGWIVNLYPRTHGFTPHMYHDPHRPGPFVQLPQCWTLWDAVVAFARLTG